MVTEEDVVLAYRFILGREPESHNAVLSHLKQPDINSLRTHFLKSKEFTDKYKNISVRRDFYALDLPEIKVDHLVSPTLLSKCIANIKDAWSFLGITRPHHSVLTNNIFLPESFEVNRDEFFASGESEANVVRKILARNGLISIDSMSCVEYGCGVGRVTMGLARLFKNVHAYDISPAHLSLAEQRSLEIGITNCKFHLCSNQPLAPLELCDVFYSRIVFQHNPPPVIHHLIINALRSLKIGGIAIFQVPTYKPGYSFSLDEWLSAEHNLDLQMHCLPQPVVFSIISEENCLTLEVIEDGSCGADFLSQMFIVKKIV